MNWLSYSFSNLIEHIKSNPKYYCPFTRFLSYSQAKSLSRSLSKAFNSEITIKDVDEVSRIFRRVEKQMEGRIAGDLEDHVLNYFLIRDSARLGDGQTVHGEIGVLFGGSLLMSLFALDSVKTNRKMVAIDPLDGYYGDDALDPLTQLHINQETVIRNITGLGFDIAKILIIPKLSESVETLDIVRDLRFASIWIDGDHSYEGIKRDWNNYSKLIIPKGYVLFDNYHDQYTEFPGIDKFIDEDLLLNLIGWEVVIILGRSILLRKL